MNEELLKKVKAARQETMKLYFDAMLNKMVDAIEKDPSRTMKPWALNSHFLRFRLNQEHAEWIDGVRRTYGTFPFSLPDSEAPETDDVPIEVLEKEMREIEDRGNFNLFLWGNLYWRLWAKVYGHPADKTSNGT